MEYEAIVNRFLDSLAKDPETATLATYIIPLRAMAGQPEYIVETLDKLAGMWAAAKGVPV